MEPKVPSCCAGGSIGANLPEGLAQMDSPTADVLHWSPIRLVWGVLASSGCCDKCALQTQGFKTTLILFPFWRAEVQRSFTGLRSRCQQGCFFLEALRGEAIALPVLASRGHHAP